MYTSSRFKKRSFQRIRSITRAFVIFRNFFFYCEKFLASHPNLKLWDYPLSAVRDCLFSTFKAALDILTPSTPPATRGLAVPWWEWSTWHSYISGTFQTDGWSCQVVLFQDLYDEISVTYDGVLHPYVLFRHNSPIDICLNRSVD